MDSEAVLRTDGGRWDREPYRPEDLKEQFGTKNGRLAVTCPGCFTEWFPNPKCCISRYAGDPFCPECGTDFRLRMVDLPDDEWPVGLGAVLYEDRHDTPTDERRLHHVVGRRVDADTGEKFVVIEDGTHTARMHYHVEDVLADFAPAGWSFPISRKPTYHLTRNCGVYDAQDRMLEANR